MTTNWINTSRKKRNATALFFFNEELKESLLTVSPGDKLTLIKESEGWYYAKNMTLKTSGLIPTNFVVFEDLFEYNTDNKNNESIEEILDILTNQLEIYGKNILDLFSSNHEHYYSTLHLLMSIINDRLLLIRNPDILKDGDFLLQLNSKINILNRNFGIDCFIIKKNKIEESHPEKILESFELYNKIEMYSETQNSGSQYTPNTYNFESNDSHKENVSENNKEFHINISLSNSNVLDFDTENTEILLCICDVGGSVPQYLTNFAAFELSEIPSPRIPYTRKHQRNNLNNFIFANLKNSDLYKNLVILAKVYKHGKVANEKKKDHNGSKLMYYSFLKIEQISKNENKQSMSFYAATPCTFQSSEDFLKINVNQVPIFTLTFSVSILNGSLTELCEFGLIPSLKNVDVIKPRTLSSIKTIDLDDKNSTVYIELSKAYIDKSSKGNKLNLQIDIDVINSEGVLLENCISRADNYENCSHLSTSVTLNSNAPSFDDVIKITGDGNELTNSYVRFTLRHVFTTETKKMTNADIGFTLLRLKQDSSDCFIQNGSHKLHTYKSDLLYAFEPENYCHWNYIYGKPNQINDCVSANVKDYIIVKSELVSISVTTNPFVQLLKSHSSISSIVEYSIVYENLLYLNDREKIQCFDDIIFSTANIQEHYNFEFHSALRVMLETLSIVKEMKINGVVERFKSKCIETFAPNLNKKIYKCLIDDLSNLSNSESRETIKSFLNCADLVLFLMTHSNVPKNYSNNNSSADKSSQNQTISGMIIKLLYILSEKLKVTNESIDALKLQLLKILPKFFVLNSDIFNLNEIFSIISELMTSIFMGSSSQQNENNNSKNKNLLKFSDKFFHAFIKKLKANNPDDFKRIAEFSFNELIKIHEIFKNKVLMVPFFKIVLEIQETNPDFKTVCENLNEKILEHLISKTDVYINHTDPSIDEKHDVAILGISILLIKLVNDKNFKKNLKDSNNETKTKIIKNFCKHYSKIVNSKFIHDKYIYLTTLLLRELAKKVEKIFEYFSEDQKYILAERSVLNSILEFILQVVRLDELQYGKNLKTRDPLSVEEYNQVCSKFIEYFIDYYHYLKSQKLPLLQNFLTYVTSIIICIQSEFSLKEKMFRYIFHIYINEEANNPNSIKFLQNSIIETINDNFDIILLDESIIYYIGGIIDKKLQTDMIKSNKNLLEALSNLKTNIIELQEYNIVECVSGVNTLERDLKLFNIAKRYKISKKGKIFGYAVSKLANLKIKKGLFIEAGCLLMEYASILQYSKTYVHKNNIYIKEMEVQRKYNIISEAIKHISKENYFEMCIPLHKELINIIENYTFEYDKLIDTINNYSYNYKLMMESIKINPSYFLIYFIGNLHTEIVRNKKFIYRGKNYCKLSDIMEQMRKLYPNAEVIGSLKDVKEKDETKDTKFIFCTGVLVSRNPELDNNEKYSFALKNYYMKNEVDSFYQNKHHNSTGEIKDNWVTKIIYKTEFKLPGCMEYSLVVDESSIKLSPIEVAINDITSKTYDLKSITQEIDMGNINRVFDLTSLLNGIIDSAVNGGTIQYCKIFLDDDTNAIGKNIQFIKDLREALYEQFLILHEGLQLHEKYIEIAYIALHNKMILMFNEMIEITRKYTKRKIDTHEYSMCQIVDNTEISTVNTPKSKKSIDSLDLHDNNLNSRSSIKYEKKLKKNESLVDTIKKNKKIDRRATSNKTSIAGQNLKGFKMSEHKLPVACQSMDDVLKDSQLRSKLASINSELESKQDFGKTLKKK